MRATRPRLSCLKIFERERWASSREKPQPTRTGAHRFFPVLATNTAAWFDEERKENVWCMPVCLCLSERLFLPRSIYLNRSEQWSTNSRAAVHPCSLCALFKTSNSLTIQARPFLPDLQPRSAPRVRPSAAPALTFALCSLALRDAAPPPHTGDRAPVASARPRHIDTHT
jgi:hypothetical protein